MAVFCLPKQYVEKIKEAFASGLDVAKLYNMSPKETHDFFVEKTDEEIGSFLNAKFTEAKLSEKKTALEDFFKGTMSPREKAKPIYKNILDKINNLDQLGALTTEGDEALYEDLISDKLGVSISPEEIKTITEKAAIIQEKQEKVGTELGNPNQEEQITDFLLAKSDMDKYLLSLSPSHNLRILTGTIGRGMMLASVKSPILNIGSNIEIGLSEAIVRRITSGKVSGANNKLAADYIKMVNRVYQKTGYDLSRMITLNNTGSSGKSVLGETVHSQGAGAVPAVGRVVEDIVFKQLMGAPDVAFASAAFADSVNLNAIKMANGDNTKATEFMVDAMRIEPQTDEGKALREKAILDAQTSTWTNKTWASFVSEGIRKILNTVSGDLRAGDYLLPYVKTPANVVATGIDYAGGGVIKTLYKTVNAIRNGEFNTKQYWQSVSRDLVRSGIGLSAALVIAANLDDDDFVGAYDPGRAQIEQLKNSQYNAIKIGNKWINVAWFGPLSTPLMAIMYARKYGDTMPEMLFQYTKGAGSSVLTLPGISDIYDSAKALVYKKKDQSLEEMTGEAAGFFAEELWSRLVPSITSDVAKGLDEKERVTSGKTMGIPNTVISKVPGLRETLPEKKNVFGETIEGEPWWSDILFGSRVKTDRETSMIREISNVSEQLDKPITFTNWDKSSSATLRQFKEELGEDRFNKAKQEYGEKLKAKLEDVFDDSRYKRLATEDKYTIINSIDSQVMDDIYDRYNFKYQRERKKKLPKF